ncbi:MAG: helix-turn-helix domain-containing protein [Polyangiaceae bacterium]
MVRRVKPFKEPRLSAQEATIGRAIRALAAFFRRDQSERSPTLRKMLADPKLGPRHARLLSELSPGARSVGELAERLGVRISTASQLVGELRRAALVMVEPDPDDRRRLQVRMRAPVQRDLDAFMSERIGPLRRALAGLDARERLAFVKGLALWGNAVEEAAAGQTRPIRVDRDKSTRVRRRPATTDRLR